MIEKKPIGLINDTEVGETIANGEVDPRSLEDSRMATAGDAKEATSKEHEMTLQEALRKYKKSVGWALALYMALIMENYDVGLIGSFLGYPSFRKKYGEYSEENGWQLAPQWQVAMGLATTLGLIFGIVANGWLIDRFGYRRVLLVAYVAVCGFIFIPFFAPTIGVLFAGEVLCGLPWGIFAIAGSAYASEVSPVVLRGYLQVYGNLCAIIGQFIAAGVLQGLVNLNTQWSYRIPFAVQWAWPVPLAILTFLAPESPWWLVRKGRLQAAEHSLSRLSNANQEERRQTVAMMVHTDEFEREISAGTSYLDCFKGTAARRTEITSVMNTMGSLCGFAITSANTYFMEQAGLPASDAYKLGLGSSAIGFVATSLSWVAMGFFGRRTIALGGLSMMGSLMILIGILGSVTQTNGVKWAQPVLLLVWTFVYDLTIGPVTWGIAGEISGTRLRAKTIGIGRNAYNLVNIVNAVATPYIINPNEANWRGKAGYLAGGITMCLLVWGYFRIPETKGRTYEEIDIMFDRKVSARKFGSYEVDAYHEEDEKLVLGHV